MDVFTFYYKTVRAPQQGYKSILKMPTRIEEGKDRYCLMSHQWNFDETGEPIAKSPMEFWSEVRRKIRALFWNQENHTTKTAAATLMMISSSSDDQEQED
uniref:Uncharacterized protein n=1 Tax=Tanacetum cinerariifolium TaxID=118510 RepID=A0A699GTF8_TANCI|nr:hypothetical protein [Tanacetum cinerariifolium]